MRSVTRVTEEESVGGGRSLTSAYGAEPTYLFGQVGAYGIGVTKKRPHCREYKF
jgi:hypothetical protein